MNIVAAHTGNVACFNSMRSVFHALKISAGDYDWYLSNIGATNYGAPDQWMTGGELHDLIFNREIQFVWGVLSAVPRGYRCKIVDVPFVWGNQAYWGKVECRPQLKDASFEIAIIDGNVIILIGLSAEAASNFCEAYPDAMSLNKHNLINGARRQAIEYNSGYSLGYNIARFFLSLRSYLNRFSIFHVAPLSAEQFKQIAARKLRERFRNIQPAINVAVVGNLELIIGESQGILFSTFLVRCLDEAYEDPSKVDDVLERVGGIQIAGIYGEAWPSE